MHVMYSKLFFAGLDFVMLVDESICQVTLHFVHPRAD